MVEGPKKWTMGSYEKSAMDKKADRKGAKKAGMTVSQWERSSADKKADKKAISKLNAKGKSTPKK